MALTISGSVIPTGGMCLLAVSGITGGPLAYYRSFGSGAFQLIDAEPNPGPYAQYLDNGVGLPGPLPANVTGYNYQVVDGSGASAAVLGITPVVTLDVRSDYVSSTFVRGLQAGVEAILLPAGYGRPQVYHEMPRMGFPALPFVYTMLTQMEQSQTQIGQDVPTTMFWPTSATPTQAQTISVMARRTWRVSVYSATAGERDFWRDAVLAIWTSLLASLLQPIAQDMSHSWITYADQKTERGADPGFYSLDLLLRYEGLYNVGLTAHYGPISTIAVSSITAGGTGFPLLPIVTVV